MNKRGKEEPKRKIVKHNKKGRKKKEWRRKEARMKKVRRTETELKKEGGKKKE